MTESVSFFDRPNVVKESIPVADGIPFGYEVVINSAVGVGGVYGSWGESYDNSHMRNLIEQRSGEPLKDEETISLADLGFLSRHHTPNLSDADQIELEMVVGERMLREAARTSGWETKDVEGVLLGVGGPVVPDYLEQICRRAGIRESVL